MSRAKYINEKLNAKKRQVMLMRGGITATALCTLLFFLFMPDATSGTGGLAERENPAPEPIEEPIADPIVLDTVVPEESLAQADTLKPDSLQQVDKDELEEGPLLAENTPVESTTTQVQDIEGGSRSPERENTNTTQTQSNTANVQFESPEDVLGSPSPEAAKIPIEEAPTYMKMPDYKSATLKYKLGLIGSDAYSPSDKERLHQHIIRLFVSPNAQVEAVYLESGGQQFTKSYPIRLYLLRLEQNPSIRIRSIEKQLEGGRLSGLIIKE